MTEERKLILRMVQEGKITPDEAEALLDALKDSEEEGSDAKVTREDDREEDFWVKIEKQGEELSQRIESASEKFSRNLEAKLEGGLSEKLSKIPKLLAKIPRAMVGEVFEFPREYTGHFAEDLAQIPVQLRTTNGKIWVSGWEEDHYKLEVVQKIRASDLESARHKQITLDLGDELQDVTELVLDPPQVSNVTISYRLYLPRKKPYRLGLYSTNGSIILENLIGDEVTISTTNGSTSIRQVRADRVKVSGSNGSSKLDYVEAKKITQTTSNGSITNTSIASELDCHTTNGSITLNLLAVTEPENMVSLSTTNGSVRCYVPRSPEIGYGINARAAVGKVGVTLDGFTTDQVGVGAGKRVNGETVDFSEKSKRVRLEADTSSGSISISHPKEEKTDGS